MAVKVYFKRTLSLIILTCFLTLLVFTSFNKAKEVKAEALSAVVLGVGCLAVLVASYFSASGIQLSQSGSDSTTYFEDFINDSIEQFKEGDAQSQAIFDQYFDSEGRYIGSEEDLKFILNPSARGYWSMGKDLVSGLESFKDWFVTENNLSVGTSSNLLNSTSIVIGNTSYPVLSSSNNISINEIPDSIINTVNSGRNFLQYSTNGYLFLDVPSSGSNYTFGVGYYVNNSFYADSSSNIVANGFNNKPYVNIQFVQSNNSITANLFTPKSVNSSVLTSRVSKNLVNFESENVESISVTGELTEGYEDFQDALDQDLENESENDDAVVVTGVGELGTDLTYDQIKELILQNVITGELNPTYEGTYENQEAAEEDLDKGEPIVTPEWRPTPVIVNGLEDFFPFCIPFDLYAVIELLNTEPVAPKFNGHLDFAGIFQAQDIELDFSQFEYLARIVRVIIVIAFLIFIILKTRDMIRG